MEGWKTMKKLLIITCIVCLLFCACSANHESIVPAVIFELPSASVSSHTPETSIAAVDNIKVEPCEWKYENGEEIMNTIKGEIGEESDTWNLYDSYIDFPRNQFNENHYMIFSNVRFAVLYNWEKSSGRIINVKDFYTDQFKSISDEIILYKNGLNFEISKNERYTIMSSPIAGLPIYVFDNEKGTAKKIALSKPKITFLIDDSLYICFADIDRYLGEAEEYPDSVVAKNYTTSVLYDLKSGSIEQTQFTKRENDQEPPDLNEYKNVGDITSHIDSFKWDGTVTKDLITKLNNCDPYKVQLYLYNSNDKTYCTQVINVFDLVQ
jgi:hypothetical protein